MPKTSLKLKNILLLLISGIFFNMSYAQFFLTPEELYLEGEEFMLAEEFNEALSSFKQIYDKGYNTANINYKIGTCYLFIPGMKENSIAYLENAVTKASSAYTGKSPDEDYAPLRSLYHLGIAYRINNQFDKSQKILSLLQDSLPDNSELLPSVNHELKNCENAQELIKAEIILKKNMLDNAVNSSFSNFNPIVNNAESFMYYMTELKFYDAIMQSVNTAGKWEQPVNLTGKIKSDGDYFVTGMSEDGKSLLLYQHDSYTRGDIYICEYTGQKWENIHKLNNNINTQFNETHASFANNNNTLYFTSDRPGGYGGLDIYKSEKDAKGEWGTAVNLGHQINTSQNEETPFITPDGMSLFFSSQGHFNMGGYDIFVSNLNNNGEWSNPANIGYPLNTSDDDLFYFPLKDGSIGYHSKYDNNISGTLNIYRFELLSKANPARFKVKGQISLTEDKQFDYQLIKIALVDKNNNDTINKKQADENGSYFYKLPSGEFELNFYANRQYLDKKSISLPEYLTLEEIIIDTRLDAELLTDLDIQKPYREDEKQFTEPGVKIQHSMQADTFIIKHLLFGFDKFSITASNSVYLSKLAGLLKKYPAITLKLNGYTDAIGDEAYNIRLSERRATQVENYLISFNIEKNRITVTGFGEESPAALNNNPDGSDNPQGRKYNRRVEIILTGTPENLILLYHTEIPKELRTLH